ncbi:MAG: hypothetical protein M5U26_14995 [Planctomycetota bacterium]|nr:hypothetical protein [Planctomycetota bacterium]
MPRGRKRTSVKASKVSSKGAKRGRKPIFTDEQKRVLDRMIKNSLRDQLRQLLKTL